MAELADAGLGSDKLLFAVGRHAEHTGGNGVRGVDGNRGQRRGASGALVFGRACELLRRAGIAVVLGEVLML